jgi:hypothetical protein
MSLEKSTISWSAKQLKVMIINGKINFDHIVQRSYVWERSRKSALIESMIVGYPVPAVYAKRIGDGSSKIYYIMDGKQRLSTVKEFLNNEYALTELPPVCYIDDATGEECECDISNLTFEELPESLRDHLNSIMFSVIYFDNLNKEEERELFKRLNAGKPLTAKSRLLASCKDIEGLLDIGSHNLFNEMLTDKARNNKNQVALVMKMWCMMNQDINDVSFESKTFNPLLEKTEITESAKIEMIEVFNLIVDTHNILVDNKRKKIAKKLYTETHLVSVVPYFHMAVKNGIDANMMADWISEFFDAHDASVSCEYNYACSGGSARNGNIVARHKALAKSYEKFFETDGISEEEYDCWHDVSDDIENSEGYKSFSERVMECVSLTEDE